MKQCLKITVSGKIHGVGYREHVQKQAEKLKIEGSIQNTDGGSVIIHVCAFSKALDDFIDALYNGPQKAEISNVVVEPLVVPKDFRGVFRIIGSE